MENTMQHYDNLRVTPRDALREIGFGNLKGKSDINPQWRIEAITNEFGPCGVGWKFEIAETFLQALADGQTMVFVRINLYIKENDVWSEAIPGFGGDFLIKKDKNGIHGNDEAYKMATTDALGTAMKMVGVAADIYRGLANDSKYGRNDEQQKEEASQGPAPSATKSPKKGATAATNQPDPKQQLLIKLKHHTKDSGLSADDVKQIMQFKFKVAKSSDLSIPQIEDLLKNSGRY
ncbi:MAG: hypothetical protein ACRC7I_10215, partial [Selenomonadaceae bacterium]